jgi:tryptophanyl-tRNA synthetase
MSDNLNNQNIVLTGDRPTGSLHLGHYIGSIQNRIKMQDEINDKNRMFILIADTQALTDYFETPEYVRANVFQLVEDYLACGLDPAKSCVFIQSTINALPEIAMYYLNLVTLARVERKPTVKAELQTKSFAKSVPCGFVCYPIFQAADITCVQANYVPVGEDQIPMIEQTNEIVRKFNSLYKTDVLKECKAVIGKSGRLLGIDGKAKASKSLNNCIFLNDDSEIVKKKVMSMYTDPMHIHKNDPGRVEGNMVFHYLDAFWDNVIELEQLKADYRKGGIGDVEIKNLLFKVLEDFLAEIRERRAKISKEYIKEVAYDGSRMAQKRANEVLYKIKDAMFLNFNI